MKRLVLVVALMGLSGCAIGRETGTAVCTAQEDLAGIVTRTGALAGTPGVIVSEFLNMGTELFCTIFAATISAPAELGDELGLTDAPVEEPKT